MSDAPATRYRRWAEASFVRPVSAAYGERLRVELDARVVELRAQIDAAGPAAVGSDWHRRLVEALCYREAELEVLAEWLAVLPVARLVEAAGHPADCRCRTCTALAFGAIK